MRCAVDGCRPVYCEICFRPSGSGCFSSTSSRRIMRSTTWIGFFCSSFIDKPHCRMRRHACGDLHRGPAPALEETGRARDLRLRRPRLLHRVHAARAAQRFGVPFTLSTMSICSIEDVAGGVEKPFWFQLYVMRDRGFAASLIERAKAAGCSALVLTLDLQIQGQRHRDLKNGLAVPPTLTLGTALDIMMKPAWALNVLRGKRKSFGNLEGRIPEANSLTTLSQWIAGQFDPTLSWKDVEWVKKLWGGKLVLKGVLDAEDAKIAAQSGADALVVSNHGGRQLDGTLSSIRALPEVVDAVAEGIEVWFDGGIRGGQDVLKALALGARATLIGRAFAYGLGAMGEAGVTRALEIIQRELDVTMALCGLREVRDANRSILRAN